MNYHLDSLKMIKKSPKIRRIARYLIIFMLVFIFFIAVMPWQQSSRGEGRVIAYSPTERQQNISAPLEARIEKWYVQEGSFVKKNDIIVKLYDNDPNILQNLRDEKKATQLRLDAAKQASALAKINVERQLTLYQEGVSSRRQYELAKLEHNKFLTEEANANAELTRVNVRLSRQQTLIVRAPMAGYILKRMAGQESVVVRAGDVLAVLVPNTESRAVEMLIDGNDIPLIRIGQMARLQFEGWPAIQFTGWPSVAVGTFAGRVAVIDQADNGAGKFRVLILPTPEEAWPSTRYLRQGVRVSGWILLSRVTLAYELWRRFNGFPPMQDSEPNKIN